MRVVPDAVPHAQGARLRRARAHAALTRFRCAQDDFPAVACHLLEYDERYSCRGDFSFYDYNEPQSIPDALRGAFDVVVADPPYLAEECLAKTAECVRRAMRLVAAR